MTRRCLSLLVALTPLWASHAPVAARQQPGARVDLPQSAGPAGGAVAVPIQLSSGGRRIGSLTLTLTFPASQLTFDRVEIGGLGEAVGAQASSKVDASGDEMRLVVTIAADPKDGEPQRLPDGPIAHVMLKLAAHLEPETVVPLKVRAAAIAATSRGEPVAIETADTEVIVSDASVIACFFYMH